MNPRTATRILSALALCFTGIAFAQEAAKAPPAEGPRFVRVQDTDDGGRVLLQVSSRTFKPAANGPVVHLVGAVHIGDQAYYESLQKFLDTQDLVLFEGVKPGGSKTALANADDAAKAKITKARERFLAILITRHKSKAGAFPATFDDLIAAMPTNKAAVVKGSLQDGWGRSFALTVTADPAAFDITSLGADGQPGGDGANADILFSQQKPLTKNEKQAGDGIQTQLADALGLKFQLTTIDYTHASWRNSDLTVDEIQERMGEGNAAAEALFSMLDGSSFAGKLVGVMLGFVKSSPQLSLMVKMTLIETLANGDDAMLNQSKALGMDFGKLMKVIVMDRNEAVFSDLKGVIEKEPGVKSVAIFYGAGHLPDMEHRLTQDMGYTFSSDQWFTAIDLDLSKTPGGAAQAKQLRASVKTMMAQQAKAAAQADKSNKTEDAK
ncbi:MAG: type II secretion system protein GspG [Planctomycetes bacterium]|nr:type II secretion system protein GspG [Planctomycetota bacterium]